MTDPTLVTQNRIHDNPRFAVWDDTLATPEGRHEHSYTVRSHADMVMVIPRYDDGSLLLEHIYRHPYRQRLWEFPAGAIVPGEHAEAAAARELAEETGYRAQRCRLLQSCEPMPGLIAMRLHIVLAEGLHGGGALAREPLEVLEVVRCSHQEAWDRAAQEPVSALLYVGLLALDHYRVGEQNQNHG